MSFLFDREESNIRKHIINIFKEKKLLENINVQNLHVVGNIYQTFDGRDVYLSVEEKSANFLLYDSQKPRFH